MKIIVMSIVLAGCGIMAEGASRDSNMQGVTLRSWPLDYKGVAVIPSKVRHIGNEAFSGCKELTAVVLPESIETIGSFAFSGCECLRDIRIPASVTNIGRSAFFNCKALTNLVILARIGKIPGNMCSHCYGLRHVELQDGPVESVSRMRILPGWSVLFGNDIRTYSPPLPTIRRYSFRCHA